MRSSEVEGRVSSPKILWDGDKREAGWPSWTYYQRPDGEPRCPRNFQGWGWHTSPQMPAGTYTSRSCSTMALWELPVFSHNPGNGVGRVVKILNWLKKKKSEWKDSDLTGFSLKWLGLSYATRQGWGLRLKFNSVIGQNSVPLRVACGLLGHPCSLGLSYLTLKSFSSGFRLLLCSVLRGK